MTAADLVAGLQARITRELRPLALPDAAFALLDFPDHANVGDSAIWLGELEAFRALTGRAPAFVCTKDAFDADGLRKAVGGGTIFLHGGGNFGDIWPQHQTFREAVLAQFPDHPVVQLPQTIHFASAAARDRAAAAIAAHGNFTLLVRDRPSYELARTHFACAVHLLPDMAFCIGRHRQAPRPSRELLFLLRTDKETARPCDGLAAALPAGSVVLDWLDEDPHLQFRQKWRAIAAGPLLQRASRRERRFHNLADHRTRRGLALLSSAAFVITDRLHCHILCTLLDIPHIVLDNNYGKLSGFIAAWTGEAGLVQVAPSMEAAVALWSARAS